MTGSTELDPKRSPTPEEELSRLPRFASRPGLHRMERLLGDGPEASPAPAIHVVGSNGKGSVSSWIAAWLSRLGFKVGLFTSPHLTHFNERFRIDGRQVSDAVLGEAMDWLRPRLEHAAEGESILGFEALAALAARIFHRAEVDVAVWEAGIGGRHDATRMFSGRLAALVSVDLEHTAVLGETLREIALDKAEIVSSGATLVLGDVPEPVARDIERAASGRGVQVTGIEPRWREDLLGAGAAPYLQHNASLAASTVDMFRRMNGQSLESWTVRRRSAAQAFTACSLPGRMENVVPRTADEPGVWLDLAHTPDATAQVAVACALFVPETRWTVVCAVSADKLDRARDLLEPLADVADLFVFTRAARRGGDPSVVERRLTDSVRLCIRRDDPAEALVEARRHGRPVLVTGSLFLAVEVRDLLVRPSNCESPA